MRRLSQVIITGLCGGRSPTSQAARLPEGSLSPASQRPNVTLSTAQDDAQQKGQLRRQGGDGAPEETHKLSATTCSRKSGNEAKSLQRKKCQHEGKQAEGANQETNDLPAEDRESKVSAESRLQRSGDGGSPG